MVELVDTPDLGSGDESHGGSSPSSRTIIKRFILMKKKLYFLILLFVFIFSNSFSQDYLNYKLGYIVEACNIIKDEYNSDTSTEKLMNSRHKYKVCMNFVMSLASTLNSRCISLKDNIDNNKNNQNFITFADLTNVNSTKDIIEVILEYSKKNLNFMEEAAWIHSSIAINKKWPCKNSFE